jgi:hypothetical protein
MTVVLRTFILLFIAFISVGSLSAQEKKKSYIIKVYTMNNKIERGYFSAADDKGVYVSETQDGDGELIPAGDIRMLQIRKKGAAGLGTAIGFVAGVAGSVAVYSAVGPETSTEKALTLVGGALGTFFTTAIGGAIGSHPVLKVHVNGNSSDYQSRVSALKAYAAKP